LTPAQHLRVLNAVPFGLLLLVLALEIWTLRTSRRSVERRDGGSFWVLHVGIAVGCVLAFTLCRYRPFGITTRLGLWAPYAGAALVLTGLGLRWWAVRTLGPLFTRDVRVEERQQVVDAGPFRWMRHPSYTGLVLELAGLGLAVRSSLSFVLIVALAITTVLYRVRIEERALVDSLGDEYVRYARRVRRFVPFVV
jgi:protein-S-isoprenylcysteine O-methyltransferase